MKKDEQNKMKTINLNNIKQKKYIRYEKIIDKENLKIIIQPENEKTPLTKKQIKNIQTQSYTTYMIKSFEYLVGFLTINNSYLKNDTLYIEALYIYNKYPHHQIVIEVLQDIEEILKKRVDISEIILKTNIKISDIFLNKCGYNYHKFENKNEKNEQPIISMRKKITF